MHFIRLIIFTLIFFSCPIISIADDAPETQLLPNPTKEKKPRMPARPITLKFYDGTISVDKFGGHSMLEILFESDTGAYMSVLVTPQMPTANIYLTEGNYIITATADNGMIYTGILNI